MSVSASDRGLSSLDAFIQNHFLPPCPHPRGHVALLAPTSSSSFCSDLLGACQRPFVTGLEKNNKAALPSNRSHPILSPTDVPSPGSQQRCGTCGFSGICHEDLQQCCGQLDHQLVGPPPGPSHPFHAEALRGSSACFMAFLYSSCSYTLED